MGTERVAAVGMVKDEADVIAGTVTHLLEEDVDVVIVADNLSTDGTLDVLLALAEEHGVERVVVLTDRDPGYRQSAKMTQLAKVAAEAYGATWIIPFDADEVWVAPDRLGVTLRELGSTLTMAPARLFNHLATSLDDADLHPFARMTWRQSAPAPLPKMAFRWDPDAVIEMGNHDVTLPERVPVQGLLQVRHFPARSAEQFTRKAVNGAAAYAAAPELDEQFGAHWRSWGKLIEQNGEDVMGEVFREHWWYLSPADSGLVEDPAPWRRWS